MQLNTHSFKFTKHFLVIELFLYGTVCLMMLFRQILLTYLTIVWISFGLIRNLNLIEKLTLPELEIVVYSVFELCNICVKLFLIRIYMFFLSIG